MKLARILTIFRKDFRDALRDSRVLVALIVPFGVGILYNVIMDDTIDQQIDVNVAYLVIGDTTLPERFQESAADSYNIRFTRSDSEATIRDEVVDGDASLAFIIPPEFDTAVAEGLQPELTVLLPETPRAGAQYVVALIDPVLRQMAGQQPPASISPEILVAGDREDVIERVGLRSYFVLMSILMVVLMICLFVVPILLAEEAEKKTLDALVLVASYGEVVMAKALFGLVYIAVGVPLLMALTGFVPEDPLLFVAGIAGLSIALAGFGLLLGATINATQLYSWGGVLIVPFLAPAFVVGVPVPDSIATAALFFPSSHATRLAANGVAGEAIFAHAALSMLALALWAGAGYSLLLWRLSRREA